MTVSAGQGDSEVVPYVFGDVSVRAGFDDGRPWFVLADLATALGYRDAADAGRRTRPDQGGTHVVCTPGGPQRMRTVTESGMYRLVLRSTRPEAERFQDWVTDEVLPAIRQRGVYATPEVNRELAALAVAGRVGVDAVAESTTARAIRLARGGTPDPERDRLEDLAETRVLVDLRQHFDALARRFPAQGPVAVPASTLALARQVGVKVAAEVVPVDPWEPPA